VGADTWAFADARLEQQWRPEQMHGYLGVCQRSCRVTPRPTACLVVSHEHLPAHLCRQMPATALVVDCMHVNLRCQKQRKKRYGKRERTGALHNQVSIELRPALI
jgi:IS30 family transposase